MNAFGDRVKRLREKKGWTQEDLAKKIDKPRSTVANYEMGRIPRDKNIISRLADILETTSDYLMGRTDRSEPLIEKNEDTLDLEEIFKKPLLYKGKEIAAKDLDFLISIADRFLTELDKDKDKKD